MQQDTNLIQLKNALKAESIQKRFGEMLGKKSAGFLTSITTCVTNNDLLQKADVNSIILAASQAASLDLPINANLGFAAIIPFYDGKAKKYSAQFQIMRDGWIELALRSGQFEFIVNEVVYEGELVEKNRFTDTYVFDETKRTSDKVVGYMASFKLTNGYKKTVYWTIEECKQHGLKYSQTFKKGFGVWKDNFDSMCLKTVLKHLIKKYAPKSIELNMALVNDQASFVGDINNVSPVYQDNQAENVEEVIEVEPQIVEDVLEKEKTDNNNKPEDEF